jgi:hypothetical protein
VETPKAFGDKLDGFGLQRFATVFLVMSRLRRAWVTAGLVLFIAVHLVELARDKEHWPFFSYPMYSWLERDRAVLSHRLVGVLAENGEEVTLQERSLIQPFDQSRLADAFSLISKAPDASARWAAVVPDLFARYERRRREGVHGGRPLKGMRVYLTRHELDAWARNLERPERRDLAAEFMKP